MPRNTPTSDGGGRYQLRSGTGPSRFPLLSDHSQEDLAIFGYRPDAETRKIIKKFFLYFGYLLEPVVGIQ
jgi:hypothetical protein